MKTSSQFSNSSTTFKSDTRQKKRRKRNIAANVITGLGITAMAASGTLAGLSGAATFGAYDPAVGSQFFNSEVTFAASAASIPTGAVMAAAGLSHRR